MGSVKEFFKINKKLLLIKFHFALFTAGVAMLQPTIPVYAKSLNFSPFVIGAIFTVVPFVTLLIKPVFGVIADKCSAHRAVLVSWVLLVIVACYNLQFVPAIDIQENVNSLIPKTIKYCAGANSKPYLYFESSEERWTCALTTSLCTNWNLTQFCSSLNLNITKESCQIIQLPNSGKLNYSECKFDGVCVQSNVIFEGRPYGHWQFWILFLLIAVLWSGVAICAALTDTLCVEICGDSKLYGKQRLWASMSWGLFALLNGFIIDAMSSSSSQKNYTLTYNLMAIPLILDLIACYKIKVDSIQQSQSFRRDVSTTFKNPKTINFIIVCILAGGSHSVQWNYLFWHLEQLSAGIGDSMNANIKTVEGLAIAVQCFLGELPMYIFGGQIINKLGYGHCVTVVYFTTSLRFIFYYFLRNPWLTLPIETLHANHALFQSTMISYAKSIAKPGTEATVQSIFACISDGLGVALGSLISGFCYCSLGGSATFGLFGIVFFLLAFVNEGIEFAFRIFDQRNPPAGTIQQGIIMNII